ncbi:MAG: endonuclease/exonuclease/phosphatase family protein [Hoeflea sp.]|uniref:endonuclease/exonuclease/phosphatase family protein n=1 Tax=Hoeflea sp. TaxID=1940281 RepID=UPI001DA350A2|nr:endonuclease/exonuclease/phosphatase family protein [Hoeflea sp.]MBU4531245.1 endonuclease/exonuclease/phosphatase family protein [Alphaproteobacteria bacterium]MBU4545692.1 endonuclease/exonuclease/phosphatase family protein [Alphaproteobacteria bacterium]MBU4550661.1 endonuclease/exonuclease/phosphatase family protein [Alphaproteobacteria bacterium]MBV1724522.1 endonuclease/exonuclease/phosphatase family protein [Hoeflea sp.]MBV1760542.1 endonuclease/exonuclease/phosphatase family protein
MLKIKAEWLNSQNPDIIVMSEVNHNYVALWRDTYTALGYAFFADQNAHTSQMGAAIATKLPAKQLSGIFDHGQYAGAIVSAEIASSLGDIELHAVYARPDSGRTPLTRMKPAILDSIPRGILNRPLPQIVAGDFNAPQAEAADGTWVSFARAFSRSSNEWYMPTYRSHIDLHEFKDIAESAMARPRADMRCTFQAAGCPDSPRTSWRHSSGSEKYRLDHIVASTAIMPSKVWYTADFPAWGDHRAMIADW